jgi:hypothetical protein
MSDVCRVRSLRIVAVVVACLALVGTSGADTVTAPADSLVFTILDVQGAPLSTGEMEFCLGDDCLFVELESPAGLVTIPLAEIDPQQAYTVIYYNAQGRTIYAARGWRYVPSSWDRGHDPDLGVDRKIITPTFTGTADGQLVFSLNTEVNPDWQVMREAAAAEAAVAEVVRTDQRRDVTVSLPRFMVSWRVPFVLGGKFGADASFAGGVESVKPGLSIGAARFFGYDDAMDDDASGWLGYRVVEVSYAGNRYDTYQLMAPDVLSDVTFHRVSLSLGFGRISRALDWDLRAGISLAKGGVYDGDELLDYQGRRYDMFGVGLYAQMLRSLPLGAGANVGLVCRFGYMYYPADAEAEDIWHGGLPAVAVGLAVY